MEHLRTKDNIYTMLTNTNIQALCQAPHRCDRSGFKDMYTLLQKYKKVTIHLLV